MYYLAYVLDDGIRESLLAQNAPKYPDVIAHHITIQLNQPGNLCAEKIEILGKVDDGVGLEALVVSVDGSRLRPDGNPYHITWSLDKTKTAPADLDPNPVPEERRPALYHPAHSNRLVVTMPFVAFHEPISIGSAKSVILQGKPFSCLTTTR